MGQTNASVFSAFESYSGRSRFRRNGSAGGSSGRSRGIRLQRARSATLPSTGLFLGEGSQTDER